MAVTPSFELVGRGREHARLVDFAARVRERSAALLIRGEPGIGKTILWREAVAAAEREGSRVLVSRCAEAEMPISLGAVSDLLDPVFAEVADELVEPQRRALAAALGTETGPGARPDRLTLLRGLVAAFRALAAMRRCSSRSTTSSGSTPRRHACSRSPYVGSARSRSASSRP